MTVPIEPRSVSTTPASDKVITAGVPLPSESLFGAEVRDKVVSAVEAVRLIRDGDAVVVEGFMGQGYAEELTLALEQRSC